MMDKAAIKSWLDELDQQQIYVYLQAGQLKLRTALSQVPSAVLAQIKANRGALIDYLAGQKYKSGALSAAQQRMWFIHHYEGGTSAYNMTALVKLSHPYTLSNIESAVTLLREQHEILRSQFKLQQGKLIQQVYQSPKTQVHQVILTEPLSPQQLPAPMQQELDYIFDLEKDCLFRVSAIIEPSDAGVNSRWLLFNLHHIIIDGWSVELLLAQLLEALSEQQLPPPQLQYLDYVHWEQQFRQSPDYQQQLQYWCQQLKGSSTFELPPSYPRSNDKQYHGHSLSYQLAMSEVAGLNDLCQRHELTRFSALLGSFYGLLYRYTQQADITLGVPVANRQQPEFEAMLGCFINTLPLRLNVDADHSLLELLQQVQHNVIAGLSHQSVAVEDIIEALDLPKSSAHSPLFQILFNYNGVTTKVQHCDGEHSAELVAVENQSAKFDLTLSISESSNGLLLEFNYATALYEPELIAQLAEDYVALISLASQTLQQRLSDISLPSCARYLANRQLPVNHSDAPVSPLEAIYTAAAERGDAIALVEPNDNGEVSHSISYHALITQVERVAAGLATAGSVVAFVSNNDSSDLIMMLAVMRSGRAYLPVDANMPLARVMTMLQLADCRDLVVKGGGEWESAVPQTVTLHHYNTLCQTQVSQHHSVPVIAGDDSAYIMFTSGSTGTPKGVEISHRALAHYCHGIAERVNYNQQTCAAVVTGLATDLCLTCVYPVLAQGGKVVLTLANRAPDPTAIAAAIATQQVNLVKLTPSFAAVLLPSLQQYRLAVSQWLLGGEALGEQLVNALRKLTPTARIFNHYGPTEACVGVSCADVTEQALTGHSYPIGSPLSHVEPVILDSKQQPSVPGMAGELYLGGPSLAKGYKNAAAETAQQFVELTLPPHPPKRFYRTGDLVKLNTHSELVFLGRSDNQVKVRGYRVDISEVEAKLLQLAEIAQAAVTIRKLAKQEAIVAFVVIAPDYQVQGATAIREGIRQGLKQYLPEPMLPSWIELCQQLPQLSNGKIDRRTLASQGLSVQQANGELETQLQRDIAVLYQRLTGSPSVGLHDSFFAIGGHSLLAMQLVNQLREQFAVEVSLKQLFAHPSISELSELIDNTATLEQLPQLTAAPEQADYPLSFSQRRLWFIDQLQGHSFEYNLQGVFELQGELNRQALQQAFRQVIAEQPIIAFNYRQSDQGEPRQFYNPRAQFVLQYHDWQDKAEALQTELLQQAIIADYQNSFDLERELLLRASVYQLAESNQVLIITLHHIVADGWSIACFSQALSAAYNNVIAGTCQAPQVRHYVDYVSWQQQLQNLTLWQTELDYWRAQLAAAPKVHELPLDHHRDSQRGVSGALLLDALPQQLTQTLRDYSARAGQTLYLLLQTVFSLWLSRASQQRDVIVATPVSGRHLQAFEGMIGNFINTLMLRSRWSAETNFNQAVSQMQTLLSEALQHQHVPFDVLVDELEVDRSGTQQPLHQVVFRVNNQVNETLRLDGLAVKSMSGPIRGAKLDLEVAVIDDGEQLQVEWLYDANLWQRSSIQRFHEQFSYMLSQCLSAPQTPLADLALWSPQAQQAFLQQQQGVSLEVSHQGSWASQFSARAADKPLQVAVRDGDNIYSYVALESAANQLANSLLEMALPAQSRIAIMLPASSHMVAAVLAVMKAQHTYVPLHHDLPTATLSHILADAEVAMTLAFSEDAERLIESGSDFLLLDDLFAAEGNFSFYEKRLMLEPETRDNREQDLAYIIYTSGSTGQPKGVAVSHGNLDNYLQFASRRYLAGDKISQAVLSTPLAFDATVTALMPVLMQGGALTLLPVGAELLPALTEQIFNSQVPQLFKLTPAHLRAVLALSKTAPPCLLGHRFVIGGEALSSELLRLLQQRFPEAEWINEYGPTEATVGCSIFSVDANNTEVLQRHTEVPIGHAIDNTQLLVMDEFAQPAPPNMPGELWIAGAGVCQGYINLPSVSDSRFSEETLPQYGHAKLRWYRSGDRVKWQAGNGQESSYLCYLGRRDEQVKLRGYRVDLANIGHFIMAMAEVQNAVLTVDRQRDSLIAHVMVQQGSSLTLTKLRRHLSEHLPNYMLPAQLDIITQLPLTANGKVDTAALQQSVASQKQLDEVTAIDESQLTQWQGYVLALYREVLPNQVNDLEQSFFDLGGHSLLAIKVISQIRQQRRLDITLGQLFAAPSVAALAEVLEHCERLSSAIEIPVVSREQQLPLSFAQQRLWLIDQLQGHSQQYHMPASYLCHGELKVAAVQAALEAIVERHEVLRSVIVQGAGGAEPHQVIKCQVTTPVELEDLSTFSPSEQRQRWQALQQQWLERPFDLSQDTMLRVLVVRFSPLQHGLLFNMHHIASDGWSMALLAQEFVAFYRHFNAEAGYQLADKYRAPLAIQYADFAVWQLNQREALAAELSYWQQQLAGAPMVHELALDYERPALQSLAGGRATQVLSRATVSAIKSQCSEQGVTLFIWLHSLFSLLVLRLSQSQDVVIGAPVAGRQNKQVEDLLGCFVNTLAIRATKAEPLSFTAWLAQQKQVILDAFGHQNLPFEQLVETLNPPRHLGHQPLVQILFALQNNEHSEFQLPELHIEPEQAVAPNMKFDLEVNAIERDGAIELEWNYASALFKPSSVATMISAFSALIEAALNTPEQVIDNLPVLGKSESQALLSNPPMPLLEVSNIDHQLQRQVELQGQRVAVSDPQGKSLTFAELEARAKQLCHYLTAQGVKPQARVAVALPPSCELVVALWAIWKAGACYVPLDLKSPPARQQAIISNSQASLLMTHTQLQVSFCSFGCPVVAVDSESAWRHSPDTATEQHIDLDSAAYLIYTSGTTGEPKGVVVTQRSLQVYLAHVTQHYCDTPLQSSVVATPLAFDATVTSLWGALVNGVGVQLLGDDDRLLEQLACQLQSKQPQLFKLTPAHLYGVLPKLAACDAQHCLVIGGEALPAELVIQLAKQLPNSVFINEYGPTEATVGCSYSRYDSQRLAQLGDDEKHQLSIGAAIAGCQLVVLDHNQQLLPPGVPGELYIGGANLAQGYYGMELLTAEKFSEMSLADGRYRYYRSGDRVRWRLDDNGEPDGLQFLGRLDGQVKLRGYRIELQEIKLQLERLDEVQQAWVMVNDKGDNLIAALVMSAQQQEEEIVLLQPQQQRTLLEQLQQWLPAYMLPYQFYTLKSMPLSSNGKVDHQALKRLIAHARESTRNDSEVEMTALEQQLAAIFSTVLDTEVNSPSANFFELGGHSLSANQCVALIEQQLRLPISMRVLFERPTVQALATWCEINAAALKAQQDTEENDASEEMFL